jgi:hypothetical protein
MAKKHRNELLESEGAPSVPATPVGSAIEVAPRRGAEVDPPAGPAVSGWLEPVGANLTGSVQFLRGLLPSSRVPLFLASTALVVTGLVDPPVALGAGLALEALRRWEPAPRALTQQ